ncbi:GumC family protein [Agrobacterium salinitolerans]
MLFAVSQDHPMLPVADTLVVDIEQNGGQSKVRPRMRLIRRALSELSFSRIALGGRINDSGRLPRYIVNFGLCLSLVWIPIGAYLKFAPRRYASEIALILPGAGASTSINLSDIGQASSSANSAYSSSTLSPTVTYQSLLQSTRVAARAAKAIGEDARAIGKPTVKLLDQTSLINVTVSGGSPEQAQRRAQALLESFMFELDKLREDEIARRENATSGAVKTYRDQVEVVRDRIIKLQAESGLNSKEQYNSYVSANDALKAKISELQATLSQTNDNISALARILRVTPERAAITLKLRADPVFVSLADTFAKDGAAFAELSGHLGPNHPRFVSLRNQVEGLRRQMINRANSVTQVTGEEIAREIDTASDTSRAALLSQLVTLVSERNGKTAELSAFRDTLTASEGKVQGLTDVAARLEALDSDYKVAEAVFASALARINTSKTDVFASYPMVQVADTPALPLKPTSPSLLIGVAAGVAATFFLFLAYALAWVRRPLLEKIGRTMTRGDHEA